MELWMPWPRPWWNSNSTDAFTAHTLYLICYAVRSLHQCPFKLWAISISIQCTENAVFFFVFCTRTHSTSVATSMKQRVERHRPFECFLKIDERNSVCVVLLFGRLLCGRFRLHCVRRIFGIVKIPIHHSHLCWQKEIRCGNVLRVRWIFNFRLHVPYVCIVFITRAGAAFTW